jgi:two-component system LytT family sensor kinase
LEQQLVTVLLKVAVAASLASILARPASFKRMLMREERTLLQRLQLALTFALIFGLGVAIRVLTRGSYSAVDLGLEGALLAGILGGYVTGLLSGVLISIPAMIAGELLSMPLFAGVGVLAGVLRDSAPATEEIWRFSPFIDLSLYRLIRRGDRTRTIYHLFCLAGILFAEFLRWLGATIFGRVAIFSVYGGPIEGYTTFAIAAYASTLFSVTVPLKIWNSARTEMKLEAQQRLLSEARLEALRSQINPHFLFNTLNSIASLIRTNPEQARVLIYKLSNILRRLLKKHDDLNPLRDELAFIDDYLSIEMVRFGPKLRFEKEVDPETLVWLVPSMLLQPIVENSIRHGLTRKVEGGVIRIKSSVVNGKLHLTVEDDGVGIPEAKLATLLEQGIGVSNVNERLKVLYATDYRMWIDSKPGEGTRTEIEIPELHPPMAQAS